MLYGVCVSRLGPRASDKQSGLDRNTLRAKTRRPMLVRLDYSTRLTVRPGTGA